MDVKEVEPINKLGPPEFQGATHDNVACTYAETSTRENYPLQTALLKMMPLPPLTSPSN